MIKASDKELKKVQLNWEMLRAADCPARQDFIERFEDDTAFYFHQQFTQDEKTRKRALKQLDIPIDRVRPIIRRTVAKIVRNRPTVAALTLDPSAIDISRRVNAQVQYCMRISKGLSQIRRCVMNSVRGGLGYLWTVVDSETGEKEVKIKYINAKKIFIDPASQDPLFDDARYIQILEKVPISDALEIFRDSRSRERIFANALTSFQDDQIINEKNDMGGVIVGSTIEEFTDIYNDLEQEDKITGWVELLTTYRKVSVPIYKVRAETGEYDITKEEYLEAKEKGADVFIDYKNVISEEINTESYELRNVNLEHYNEYPITPMIWEDTENPYPISETFFARGNQRLQNAYYQVVISNAQAVSFPNVWFETSAFVNKNDALIKMSIPGGAVEFNDGALVGKKAEKTYAQPLNQAFFTLYEQLKHEQEYQASAPAFQGGDPSNIPETYRGLVNLDSYADRPLAINVDAIEACLERVFKNVIRAQAVTYTQQKLLLIDTKPENNMVLNETIPQVGSNGELILKNIDNDIAQINYDIQLIPGSMSPLDKTSEFQYAMQAVELGVTPEFALRRMPITGIEEEIEKMDTVRQLQQQNMQLQQMLQQMGTEMQKMTKEVDKSEKAVVDTEYRAKYEINMQRMNDMLSQMNRELRTIQRTNTVLKKNVIKSAQTQNESAEKE